jgi:ubiquinone/menaquinone biosynthesis C-methylase UbiE
MSTAPVTTERADYGIDAPGVVRNLFLCGAAGLLVGLTAVLGLWSGEFLGIPLAGMGLGCAISFTATGVGMLWYSKVGKLRARERLLDHIKWKGNEAVLDVGCGRGLLLIGAAKRLTEGKATGIDIWQTEDLSGNRPEATRENARREGVADRIEVRTADMRQLPFSDGSFDVAMSSAAIHNLYAPQDRAQAIREIARVLKPGGQAVIADIRHHGEYAAVFAQHGCPDVRQVSSPWARALAAAITFGSVRPAVLVVRKAG